MTGGLKLSTGATTGFSASGGGTVTVTQNNSTVVNTIATTTATALNVSNTGIGAARLTFRSISAGTAASAILLANTVRTARGEGRLSWAAYLAYSESDDMFLLWPQTWQCECIPKRAFETADDVDAFRALLRRHLPESPSANAREARRRGLR